ncbi:acyl carrier protein [Planomonospora sp. ID91781]|uniref:Phosphopantetheine-binding protein n=1 Tax=Planomonospora sphaerica TaxID=161355 RepID=A0A161MFL9_9ACTN|nr:MULTISPECIES: acyl carrier protein [Planomonospora]MBG0824999.1 acyl carrier protein [Planomonospora sp. ID91781]GAT71263.1 phosphopantetheine-binding protein [Planomonospora sphaerica]
MLEKQFEEILRRHLPFISADDEMTWESDLRDLGLDSVGMVDLLSQLEGEYQVRFVDEALEMETFATPGTLWGALSRLIGTPA